LDEAVMCLHDEVARQAERQPEAMAVACDDVSLTYGELVQRAGGVAAALAGMGVAPDSRVAVFFERSVDVVVAILGILRAGCAYVPLEPSHPDSLLEFIASDSQAAALVTRPSMRPAPMPPPARVLLVDAVPAVSVEREPASYVRADRLAYLMYTSGSTGQPKAVAVTHGNLAASTRARRRQYPEPSPRCLVIAAAGFDVFSGGVFAALTAGGAAIMPGRETVVDPGKLASLIRRHAVSHWLGPWSMYAEVLASARSGDLESLRVAMVGGEPCPPRLVERHRALVPHARLFNEYGPTEATVWATAHECRTAGDPSSVVPIGRPIAGTQVYVLDSHLEPVADGEDGEIYIGGEGLARGYWRQPASTAARFVPDVVSAVPGARLFRTGDIARRRADGALEFVGREDEQTKVRGHRVELGQIEHILRTYPAVLEGVVVACKEDDGEQVVVAFVALDLPMSLAQSESSLLRQHLQAHLPEYMVPTEIRIVERLPRTLNGKPDRAALAVLRAAQRQRRTPDADTTASVRDTLTAIWCEVLKKSDIDVDDNFFDLGGHSMRLVRMASLIKQRLGQNIPVVTLLSHPSISAMAAYITQNQAVESDAVPVSTGQ
jgi:amino acid adenylation domain-containing protein